MELRQVKGNTWYLEGAQLIPLYKVDETHCILLDSGRSGDRTGILAALEQAKLTPVGIIGTHMHYDHHENDSFFRKKFGLEVALPLGEAEICRSRATLKNHLFNFSPGLIATQERLKNLICVIDRPILPEEAEITFQGANFGIIHTPGHSPDHICIVTPDNVCHVGDVLMTKEDLAVSKIPFVFDLKEDLASKERMKTLCCDAYILSHSGVVAGPLDDLADANIQAVLDTCSLFASLVDRVMTYSDAYDRMAQAVGLHPGHPVRAQHVERYLRPYLEYLADEGEIRFADGGGAPRVGPQEPGQPAESVWGMGILNHPVSRETPAKEVEA